MNMLELGQDRKIAALTIFIHVCHFLWSELFMYNEKFMKVAIEEGKKALLCDEVPIGAVIVKDDKIISQAYNRKNESNIVTRHAEIISIEKANRIFNNWRLCDCDIYVTLEPCPMCMSAIQQARIANVYYGLSNRNQENRDIIGIIAGKSHINPSVNLSGGYMSKEVSLLMTSFFKKRRSTNSEK